MLLQDNQLLYDHMPKRKTVHWRPCAGNIFRLPKSRALHRSLILPLYLNWK